MFRDISVLMVALLMTASGVRYCWLVSRRRIEPAASTWLVFFAGTSLSFATYMVAQDRDFVTGILNTMDVLEVGAILTAVLIWGKRSGVRFSRFEKLYLGGIALIIIYAFAFGDAWGSNLFVQALITLGYIPTVHKVVTNKRNTEAILPWTFSLFAGLFALVPALSDGNTLATVYAGRTVFLVGMFIMLMVYYQYVYPKRHDVTRPEKP